MSTGSQQSAVDWMAELAAAGETAELLGEWWIIYDKATHTPMRMDWAGSREMYDEACAIAEDRWGVCPITIPLSAFVPASPVGSNP